MSTQGKGKSRVLVVEDDPVVAMVVEDALCDMGVNALINLNLPDALAEIEASEFDAALVDMELRGETSRPVVLALLARGVPFVVMSGRDQTELAREFPHVRTVMKPLDLKTLGQIVQELLAAPVPHQEPDR
jgi:DNA-binding NtrC family response regulator